MCAGGHSKDAMVTDNDRAYAIREIRKDEVELLKDFLYEAIFIPEGVTPPPRSILDQPELRVYIDDFGSRKGDHCLVAECSGKVVGAVWTRIMNDYGHVDDDTPSFAISLYKEYRGKGIGTQMMIQMLELLKKQGLVLTREGKDGGYSCAAGAGEITLRHIAEATEMHFAEGFRMGTGCPGPEEGAAAPDGMSVPDGMAAPDGMAEIDMDCLNASGMAQVMQELYEQMDALCMERLERITVADLEKRLKNRRQAGT